MHERWPWCLDSDKKKYIITKLETGGERANDQSVGPKGPKSKEEKE